jgi:outer membrane protein assembly factor BamB
MVADRGNNRIILLSGNKKILWQYPAPGTTPSYPFAYDDDTFFGNNYTQIASNQEDRQTVQLISFPQGKVLWHYGHWNQIGTSPGYLHTPDDAYLLPNGNVQLADIANCRVIQISTETNQIVSQWGQTAYCGHNPPHLLGAPNGDTPLANGDTLVTEIQGSYVDLISPQGKLIWSVHAPVTYPSDAQMLANGEILMASYTYPGRVIEMTKTGHVTWSYAPTSGPGVLNHPSLAMMLPNGLIAVNDDSNDRVILIDPSTHKIVWQYGHTGQPGRTPGFLNDPDGMDFLPYQAAMANPAIKAVVQP